MSTSSSSSSCGHCGVPLHQMVQIVGYADICLGAINAIILAVHVNEELGDPDPDLTLTPTEEPILYYRSQFVLPPHKPHRTFKKLDSIPVGLTITILVCHVIQLIMGFVLIYSALNRKRPLVEFWLVITGVTALFTGIFIRIYEMIIANDFAKELLQEESENNNHNQDNDQRRRNHYSRTAPSTIQTVSENVQNQTIDMSPPPYELSFKYAPYEIPVALQPPPKYEDVVKDCGGGGGR